MRVGGVCARVIGMPRTSIRLLFNLISSSSPFISFYFETLSFFVFKKRKRILIFSSQTVALRCSDSTGDFIACCTFSSEFFHRDRRGDLFGNRLVNRFSTSQLSILSRRHYPFAFELSK